MELPLITHEKNLKGKRVLLRLDLNEPIVKGKVADDFRIRQSLLAIRFLKKSGAKTIILSHIGRKPEETLRPALAELKKYFPKIEFVEDFESKEAQGKFTAMKDGDIILVENLRKWKGEKDGDKSFAKKLATLGEIYVNDALAVSHRKDASIFLLPKLLPAYFGPLFETELNHLSYGMKAHEKFLVILGGAKFETKMPLVKKYLEIATSIFVGGALANTVFKAMGHEVGKSLIDEEYMHSKTLFKNKKLILPIDVVVIGENGKRQVKKSDQISTGDNICDVGPETVKMLTGLIQKEKFVLWNGPLGYYEGGFTKSTIATELSIIENKVSAVIGGGDTLAALKHIKKKSKKLFISTAGGAMLEFLAKGTLPGIEAVTKK